MMSLPNPKPLSLSAPFLRKYTKRIKPLRQLLGFRVYGLGLRDPYIEPQAPLQSHGGFFWTRWTLVACRIVGLSK